MILLGAPSSGFNLLGEPKARGSYYPPATVAAAFAAVWLQEMDGTGALLGVPVLLGNYGPNAVANVPYSPDTDRTVRLIAVPHNAAGIPAYNRLEDAPYTDLTLMREPDAPVIGQNAPATAAQVEIGITGFTRFARLRRVTISANADMSSPLEVLLFDSQNYIDHELPRYFTLNRDASGVSNLTLESGSTITTEAGGTLTTEAGTVLPLTVYLTVAHSGGAVWTAESNILLVTFAATDGTGGTGGDFDPTPRDQHDLGV